MEEIRKWDDWVLLAFISLPVLIAIFFLFRSMSQPDEKVKSKINKKT